ncbi:hypothetical protein Fmac_024686 [Flemingia macrophylla]|uniref:Uncharacterized protein n=1 Tax=Flemingia macrophylla TaxID=520843 RepID=A0ABD1LQ68_9FABA
MDISEFMNYNDVLETFHYLRNCPDDALPFFTHLRHSDFPHNLSTYAAIIKILSFWNLPCTLESLFLHLLTHPLPSPTTTSSTPSSTTFTSTTTTTSFAPSTASSNPASASTCSMSPSTSSSSPTVVASSMTSSLVTSSLIASSSTATPTRP